MFWGLVMKVFFVGLLLVTGWISESCYGFDAIHSSIGVFDPNPYVDKKEEYSKPVHSRMKRSSAFSSNEEQAILDKHNDLRSGVSPEASDMKFMVWDDDLATLAQEWSDMCIWDHGTPVSDTVSDFDPYGQNLWLGGGSADNKPDGIGMTQAWYNEVGVYDYESRECTGVCGHYTQVVWADSYALGCGITFCEATHDGKSNVWLMTCHYGLAGNYNRHPYLSGSRCTKCSSGSGQCYNNQCRSCDDHNEECICNQECRNCGTVNSTSCKCDCPQGFIDGDCSAVCEDTHDYCEAGWYKGQCADYDYVRNGCPLMCDSCSVVPDNFVCEEESPSESTTQEPVQMTPTQGTTQEPVQMTPTQAGDKVCSNECQNGGTIDAKCNCACVSGYQGDTCEENQKQVQNGVQITIVSSISIWDSILQDLLDAIEAAIDDHCNIDGNYGTCCPNSGLRTGEGTLNYINNNEIFIADGFPRSVDTNSFETMLYAIPAADNALCEAGSTIDNRKRRDLDRLARIKRDVTVYLDQDVLYNAIMDSESEISTAIGVELGDIERGVVENAEEPVDEGGISNGVIAAIVIVVIIAVLVAFGVVYFCLKSKQGKVGNSADGNSKLANNEDMQPTEVNT